MIHRLIATILTGLLLAIGFSMIGCKPTAPGPTQTPEPTVVIDFTFAARPAATSGTASCTTAWATLTGCRSVGAAGRHGRVSAGMVAREFFKSWRKSSKGR
jgi:hypothetical protein